ncbi:hypothetical protein DVH24_017762 [Malus domestica]|uniref:Phytocyanin domain-containing protein n=1 Tax=Malus domestica TaxID=3750 RepID=A0A498KBL0_MALDO|nr:hypothetical protein DVH24_017762 [Malus domestica]
MGKELSIALLAIAVVGLLHSTGAMETHVVGDKIGWVVPPGGQYAYESWAAMHHFAVGDLLVFNFTNGDQDVARVTKEAFDNCNSTDPITLKTTSPANFTLNTTGEYYFIGTKDKHCELGQKLATNVTAEHGSPAPSPAPRGPVTYVVGDKLGWLVPGGEQAYAAWAYGKTFIVGDTLVFNIVNGTQDDVALVTKPAYENCTTNSTIAVYKNSPVSILLNTSGEHFFISTYDRHCLLGQKLAINVTSSTAQPPSGSMAPSSPTPHGTSGPGAAHAPFSSAPSRIGSGYFTFLLIAHKAFLYIKEGMTVTISKNQKVLQVFGQRNKKGSRKKTGAT